MKKLNIFLTIILLTGIVLLASGFISQSHRNSTKSEEFAGVIQKSLLQIRPSPMWGMLEKKKRNNPKISLDQLASEGNKLITKYGYNFEIWDNETVEKNKSPKIFKSGKGRFAMFPYEIFLADGKAEKAEFFYSIPDFIPGSPMEGICGECTFYYPCTNVTKDELTIMCNEAPFQIKRPKNFVPFTVSLMDSNCRKILRTWEVPLYGLPAGISKDQTKLYFEGVVSDLYIEVSEHTVSIKAKTQIDKGEFVQLKDAPENPENPEFCFVGYKHGNQLSVLRGPCPCD